VVDSFGWHHARESRGEDPPSFDGELYRKRNVVERCVGKLEQWRAVAIRYEKPAPTTRPWWSSPR
jgi:transposase